VRPNGDYYFRVKPDSGGSTVKGSNWGRVVVRSSNYILDKIALDAEGIGRKCADSM
jgi:hypothetical protein